MSNGFSAKCINFEIHFESIIRSSYVQCVCVCVCVVCVCVCVHVCVCLIVVLYIVK